MNKGLFILLFFLFTRIFAFSQIQLPKTLQLSGFQPINSNATISQFALPTNQVALGATSQDVINDINRQAINETVAQKQQEVAQLLCETQADQYKRMATRTPYNPAENAEVIKGFAPALSHLRDMLQGKAVLSVADAYYTIESAYGTPYLTRQQYYDIIDHSIAFIKTWMQQNGLDLKDNDMVQYAIQKFMSTPLTITKTDERDKAMKYNTVTHQPFSYDYEDYQYLKDYRNSFLTKCLATGSGQCNSMPAVYLVLAEGLGVNAYLSFAPNHSFIKHPDNTGYILNYEPTSNWEISDKWYEDNLFISQEAVRSGAYLDTLNSKQIVANCIFDLAVEFTRVDRSLNDDFVIACLTTGISYFPNNNNLESLFIYSMHLKTMLREEMRKHGISSIADIAKVPEANALYKEYLGNEAYITKLGYQDAPAGLYEEMMKESEFKGFMQKDLKINGKEKRNLFITVNQ